MIKKGVINGAKGILNILPNEEKHWNKKDSLTNGVLYSICINLIEKVESIRILEEKQVTNSIAIIVRSFLELYVQYDFILKNETDKRAKSFYYNYKLNVGKKIKVMIEQSNIQVTNEDLERLKSELPDAKNYDDYIDHYEKLSNDLYDNSNNHSQKWYNLHGEKRKFKQLMLNCGFTERDYEFFYGLGSMDIHGNSSVVNVNFSKNIITESSIPVYVIDEAISRWLNTALGNYAKFYGIDNKKVVKNYLNQIAMSIEGSISLRK
ncbi:DUF5677 domain-containing protein [Marinilactibacillus psychrotolerans]|uniref:DUF5677 domain-containing protein n=1 Tax=Marinilactibacillus psychrotolerans TaxID=191770 RepID=UPI0038845FA7